MILTGNNVREVSDQLAQAWAQDRAVSALELGRLNRILEHTPEDMTVSVQAGLTLANLQEQLSRHGQWLPLDPPYPDQVTLQQVISQNLHGPRRYGYGTVREHLIGLTVVLADGRVIKSGGRVVKNVAGFDLCKLFVGDRNALGVVVEANFKLRPRPEREAFVQWRTDSGRAAQEMFQGLRASVLEPVVLDLHGLDGSVGASAKDLTLVVGFAGRSAEVDWQLEEAARLGLTQPSSLEHEHRFWSLSAEGPPRAMSVLPSEVLLAIGPLAGFPWVARAGNGCIWHRSTCDQAKPRLPVALFERLKQTLDGKNILPALPW